MKILNKKIFLLVLVVFLGLSVGFSFAKQEALDAKGQILTKKNVLDNGLTILASEVPGSPMVSVYALVKVGSTMEGEFLGSGITHFFEHMLFKGTDKRAVGDIAAEIQELGGSINASTSFDYTIYTITVPVMHFSKALDVLSDMLRNPKFDTKEIEKERDVVYNEMRMRKDNPSRYLNEMIFKNVYLKHPYRLPIIGYKDLLKKLDREDFIKFHSKFYIPNNTILSIAGGVNSGPALDKAEKIFQDWEQNTYVTRNLPQEPKQVSSRRYEEEYPTELTRVSLGFSGVSLLDKDMFALDILAMILGHGESSRLYLELFKKQGIVESISVFNFTPLDRGFFGMDFIPKGEDVDLVISRIKEQIDVVKNEGVLKEELDKAKRQVLSSYVFEKQTSSDVAYQKAKDEAFLGDFDFSEKYVNMVKSVTNEDIIRVAREYLVDNSLSVTILTPKKEKGNVEETENILKEQNIKKLVLDNGLTILLKEDHSYPIVSINLLLQGGTRVEDVSSNGVSNLTSNLWIKGTKTLSAEQISKKVESLGMRLDNFSGRNSFGLTIDLLSEDIDFAVSLLEDLVLNPAFDEKELKKEKEKILTRIDLQKDSIWHVTSKNFREALFKNHSMRFDTLGTKESIENISRKEILEFFQKFAVAGNMVLSVFGDFDPVEIESLLKKKFSALEKQKVELISITEDRPNEIREVQVSLDKKQSMVVVGFQGVNILDEDRYGMEVLASLLGSPFNGRIFINVREDIGQAYSAGGSFTPGMDLGVIYFYALTSQDSAQKVKKIIFRELKRIGSQQVDDEELKSIKSYINGRFQRGIEKNSSLGFTAGISELYGAGYDHYKYHDSLVNAITKEDIKRLAKKYLDLKHAVVVVTSPDK